VERSGGKAYGGIGGAKTRGKNYREFLGVQGGKRPSAGVEPAKGYHLRMRSSSSRLIYV